MKTHPFGNRYLEWMTNLSLEHIFKSCTRSSIVYTIMDSFENTKMPVK